MPDTRIAHLLAMPCNLLRVQIIFSYLHSIVSLDKVFFFAYRLILDIEGASWLFLLSLFSGEDFRPLGMNVLVAWDSFDYIHFLGFNLCCGFLEACSFISSILIGEQLHDIMI